MRNKLTINESQLTKLVMEGVRRALREMGYEHGIDADDALAGDNGDEPKGKNWFANHGIVNFKFNNKPVKFGGLLDGPGSVPPRAWVTTTFLGNRRLAGKLGGNWITAKQKLYFNNYTVGSDSILVIYQDREKGEVYQIQYNANGPVQATSANDTEVDPNNSTFSWLNQHVKLYFNDLLELTKDMCEKENEFFDSKKSKTYDRYYNGGQQYGDEY